MKAKHPQPYSVQAKDYEGDGEWR